MAELASDAASPARVLAQALEHTLLRADATSADIARLCTEAREHHFLGVCVHGSRVVEAGSLLEQSGVKVITTVGFPLGANDSDTKRFETEAAVDNGAHEIDLVMNIGRFKDGDFNYVLRELRDVVEAAEERPLKVILETCLLTEEEKRTACRLVLDSGAHFVKTSTGFSTGGATLADIQLLRAAVGPRFGVKASGGIRTASAALELLRAGANRIGTSSGVAMVRELSAG